MKKDYFLFNYQEVLMSKCKEILVENCLQMNESVSISKISEEFDQSEDDTKKYLCEYFKVFHPDQAFELDNNRMKFNLPKKNLELQVNFLLI